MAEYLAGLFFGDELSGDELGKVAREAFDFPVPLKHIGDNLYTLELFHGPTAAFKDFGAGFMGRMLGRLRNPDQKLTILTATSGDTGSAVAHGFWGIPGIEVVVLYPDGKVSDLQESQMTTLGGNIHALRVAGTFDDCQRMVKEVFADRDFRSQHNVTSANSINLLRWIPQSFYYFWGWTQWLSVAGADEALEVVVPSGNYGNLSAGMLARRMGLPIGRFVAASNANDVIPEWLRTGTYRPRPSVHTIANAMDVGAPSNYERMMTMTGGDTEAARREIVGWASSDEDIRTAIRELYEHYGYISDPHSAAGYNAARHYNTRGFWLSTAAAAKFGEVIEPVLGVAPEVPERLARLVGRSKISTPIDPDAGLLRDFVAGVM
jgi:threonine synthase